MLPDSPFPIADAVLRAEAVCKTFHPKGLPAVAALDAVSFAVRPGGVAALVGPDGSGKTTLLRIIAGLMRADSGRVIFAGTVGATGENGEDARLAGPRSANPSTGRCADREVCGNNAEQGESAAQDGIGYMPQKFGLYEDLTVQENLDLYADLRGLAAAEREKRYRELLSMAGLSSFRERLAGKLSGGMKQKLGLICTLVSPPKLLLLDEPTVGVDPLSRRELWQIIDRLTKGSGMSVVVSTSYLDEAERCDEVVLLFEGKTLARGTPESIRARSEGMAYLAEPVGGDSPRSLQARLLDAPGVIDAVPQGGAVRLVHGPLDEAATVRLATLLNGAPVRPVSAALEDSFMLLLREHTGGASGPGTGEHAGMAASPHGASPGLTARPGALPRRPGQGSASLAEAVPLRGARGNGPLPSDTFAKTKFSTVPPPETPPVEAAGARDAVIETSHVSRYFGDFAAVNDVSFTVRRGEMFGLLGPNGAGKTTTFRMLCGLLPPSKGSLFVAGVNVREAREEARRHIGYVAQKFSLYGPLNVRENLEFFAGAYGLRGREMQTRMDEVIRDFALEKYVSSPASTLPGGYKQRLAMAVGLLHKPAILFLDEPTSGADPLARRSFWKRIAAFADMGVTVIVTTHFMEEAEYCDRVLIQDQGVMLALDTPGAIRAGAAGDDAPKPDTAQKGATMDDAAKADTAEISAATASGGGSTASAGHAAKPFTMEDAFIAIVEKARFAGAGGSAAGRLSSAVTGRGDAPGDDAMVENTTGSYASGPEGGAV